MPCQTYDDDAEQLHEANQEINTLTRLLCTACQCIEAGKTMPADLVLWWRRHKEQDRLRLKEEMAEKSRSRQKRLAIQKLSPYERKLLGL